MQETFAALGLFLLKRAHESDLSKPTACASISPRDPKPIVDVAQRVRPDGAMVSEA
jgi:hypothetical protein